MFYQASSLYFSVFATDENPLTPIFICKNIAKHVFSMLYNPWPIGLAIISDYEHKSQKLDATKPAYNTYNQPVETAHREHTVSHN